MFTRKENVFITFFPVLILFAPAAPIAVALDEKLLIKSGIFWQCEHFPEINISFGVFQLIPSAICCISKGD